MYEHTFQKYPLNKFWLLSKKKTLKIKKKRILCCFKSNLTPKLYQIKKIKKQKNKKQKNKKKKKTPLFLKNQCFQNTMWNAHYTFYWKGGKKKNMFIHFLFMHVYKYLSGPSKGFFLLLLFFVQVFFASEYIGNSKLLGLSYQIVSGSLWKTYNLVQGELKKGK